MLTSLVLYNATFSANLTVNDLTYPVHHFEWNLGMTGESYRKAEAHGRQLNTSHIESLDISMEGHIVADTTTAYWTARKNLMNIVVPDLVQTTPIHGKIHMQLDGDAETYYVWVKLEDRDTPLEAFYPTVTAFQFQWSTFEGFWRKVSDNSIAKL